MDIDWHALRGRSTADLIRDRASWEQAAAGVLFEGSELHQLTAYGALAWDGRDGVPAGPAHQWLGANLLCNAAPTAFEVAGQPAASIDSFLHALKFPEGSPERLACAMAPARVAREQARRSRGSQFTFGGQDILVDSPDHQALVAEAISAKVRQHDEVRRALADTGVARLTFPRAHGQRPG
ncbi:MAG: hypothetical protein ABIT71_20455, partial [Vicinamibacteraceae bacterium]